MTLAALNEALGPRNVKVKQFVVQQGELAEVDEITITLTSVSARQILAIIHDLRNMIRSCAMYTGDIRLALYGTSLNIDFASVTGLVTLVGGALLHYSLHPVFDLRQIVEMLTDIGFVFAASVSTQ